MSNVVKWSVIIVAFSFFLFALAIFYSFAYRPYKKESNFNKCLVQSEGALNQKRSEITLHLDDLKQQKEIEAKNADIKLEEFMKNTTEPKKCFPVPVTTLDHLLYDRTKNKILCGDSNMKPSDDWSKWDKDAQKSFDVVRDIEWKMRNIQLDFKKIEEEKKITDEKCYKDFK